MQIEGDANIGRLQYGTAAWGIHGTMQIEGDCSIPRKLVPIPQKRKIPLGLSRYLILTDRRLIL
jgi:hypothetical protein